MAGVVMSRWGRLIGLVRAGSILMAFGNALVTSLGFEDSAWKYFVYVFPANLGQGIIYPGILFTSLASFDHAGKRHKKYTNLALNTDDARRPCCDGLYRLSHPFPRHCLGRLSYVGHCANYAQRSPSGRSARDIR